MNSKHIPVLFFLVVIAVVSVVATAKLAAVSVDPAPQTGTSLQARVDRHLAMMGEIGNEESLRGSLRSLAAAGPQLVSVLEDTYNQWTRAENANPKANVRPGEMRWRVIHLLGELNLQDARPFLFQTAKTPIPDCKKNEVMYADEYRIRLRAIVGLENLKAVDELKEIHEIGGVLKNPTAASLFVLGVKVNNDVSRVDARKALADDVADYRDHNKGAGRPAQEKKPGKERISPVRRQDTPVVRRQR
jgi:hypothetical protein